MEVVYAQCNKCKAIFAAACTPDGVYEIVCDYMQRDGVTVSISDTPVTIQKCGCTLPTSLPELPAAETDGNDWYCPTCDASVPPGIVTHEETHDPRYGGCGGKVEPSRELYEATSPAPETDTPAPSPEVCEWAETDLGYVTGCGHTYNHFGDASGEMCQCRCGKPITIKSGRE